jgi:hypothetical protein
MIFRCIVFGDIAAGYTFENLQRALQKGAFFFVKEEQVYAKDAGSS